jgi:hypothetical protein
MIEERPLLKIVEHKLTPIMIGALFRREVILEVGEFNPTLRIAEDVDFVGRNGIEGTVSFWRETGGNPLETPESTPNLTSQLFTSGIYAFECLQTVYEGFASDVSLTRFERARLRQIMSQNLRTLGNLYLQAGRKEKARVALKKAMRADYSLRSVGRYLTSLLPTALVLQTIRKGTQIQPGPSSS